MPGAYLLLFEVRRTLTLPIARLGTPRLPPGRYAYTGSANGPGGIRARVARHLARDKRLRWHVDFLTARVPCREVRCFPDATECDLAAALLAAGATAPVPRFGSSDCRICPAHLLRLAEGSRLPTLASVC